MWPILMYFNTELCAFVLKMLHPQRRDKCPSPNGKRLEQVTEAVVVSDKGACDSTDLDLRVLWFLGVRKFINLIFGVVQVQR